MPRKQSGNARSMVDTGVQALARTIGKITQTTEDIVSSGAGIVGLGPHARDRADETASKRARGAKRATAGRAGGGTSQRAAGRKTAGTGAAKRAGGRAKTSGRGSAARKSTSRKTGGRAKT